MYYVIEKGIPFEQKGMKNYPFDQMEVGDCFAIPAEKVGTVRNACTQYSVMHGVKFSVRRVGDCYRCWRIE